MSDLAEESAPATWRPSTARVGPVTVMVATLVVLVSVIVAQPAVLSVDPPVVLPVDPPALGGFGPAAATVGLVLAEVIALDVGYGALTRIAGPTTRELLGSTAPE